MPGTKTLGYIDFTLYWDENWVAWQRGRTNALVLFLFIKWQFHFSSLVNPNTFSIDSSCGAGREPWHPGTHNMAEGINKAMAM